MNNTQADLEKIYSAAIEAVNPIHALNKHLKRDGDNLQLFLNEEIIAEYNLDEFDNLYVVGAGKATARMALAIEQILADKITAGCISVKYGYVEKLDKIEIVEAAHPVPDASGITASKKIVALLEKAQKQDLIISLISGGGSALLPLPPEPITLEEKQQTTNLLLKSGASIHEINCIRKHISLVKGGNLARAAAPAIVINLMISDVVGDNPDVIASGPFVPDNATFSQADAILKKYNIESEVPASVMQRVTDGMGHKIAENPQSSETIFNSINNVIIASNIHALNAAKKAALELHYNSSILSSQIEGDTKTCAQWHIAIAKEIHATANPLKKPACLISGGETTVAVTGSGKGGRNTEFALQAAKLIQGLNNFTALSIGTDGSDGPTDAAGAFCDGGTIAAAQQQGLDIEDYIKNNDSYSFFDKTGTLIKTGPTNTNVMDVRIILVK